MAHGPSQEDALPAMAGRRTAGLDQAQLLLIGALRSWMAPRRAPGRPHPDWREVIGLAGIAPMGAAAFDQLMSSLARCAVRGLDIRCCGCPTIGADEEIALAAVTALQHGDLFGAVGALGEWFGTMDLSLVLRCAERFAAMMARAGWRLPAEAPAPAAEPPPRARPALN